MNSNKVEPWKMSNQVSWRREKVLEIVLYQQIKNSVWPKIEYNNYLKFVDKKLEILVIPNRENHP